MGEHILSRLQAGMDGFSKGQKRLAAYILADPRQAALKTAEELSRCAGVSASTAVRFAAALGYAGYPEMQRDLQRVALSGTAPASPAGGLTQTMEADIRQIRQAMAGLDRGAFCRSAEAAGKAAVAAAEKKAAGELATLSKKADEKAVESAKTLASENGEVKDRLRAQAEANMDRAVSLIVERIVNS